MNFNFLNPFFATEALGTGFNPAAPNPQASLTPIGPGPTTAGMPVASVDLLGDQIYPAGGMSYPPTRPGMSFEAMTGQPERQMSYGQPQGPTVAQVAGTDMQAMGGKLKRLGGMMSEAPRQAQAPVVAPPQAGGGGRGGFDVTPFLRRPLRGMK